MKKIILLLVSFWVLQSCTPEAVPANVQTFYIDYSGEPFGAGYDGEYVGGTLQKRGGGTLPSHVTCTLEIVTALGSAPNDTLTLGYRVASDAGFSFWSQKTKKLDRLVSVRMLKVVPDQPDPRYEYKPGNRIGN
jgi:hypothetical protein